MGDYFFEDDTQCVYGLDIQVLNLKPIHRVSLFSLLKLEYHDLEPCYVKIPEAYRNSTSNIFAPSFGTFLLLGNDSTTLNSLAGEIRAEIYYDRDELQLICKGETSIPCIENTQSINANLSKLVTHYMKPVNTTGTINIKLFHKGLEGSFAISAGEIELNLTAYQIYPGKLLFEQQLHSGTAVTNYFKQSSEERGEAQTCVFCSKTSEPIRVDDIPVLADPRETSNLTDAELSDNFDIAPVDYDYDPIDDFVDSFLLSCKLNKDDNPSDQRFENREVHPGSSHSEPKTSITAGNTVKSKTRKPQSNKKKESTKRILNRNNKNRGRNIYGGVF